MIGNRKRKVFMIGLDCTPPEHIFEKYRAELPHFSRLMNDGYWGKLESCHPPITVPAWSCMLSSQDPGQLGIYGFRNRADHSYDKLSLATSHAVKAERVWDILSRHAKKVIVMSVPGTYPVKPVNGIQISCFLTPSIESQYTYPVDLRHEVADVVGEYMFDTHGYRTENKAWLLRQIYEMTEKRFRLVRHFLRTKPWDFFIFVEIGTDRINHAFWKFIDSAHCKYEPGNPFETSIKDYYKYIDREIGELLTMLDDETVVLVVSDHGAQKIDGGICINEWLMQNGYLVLKSYPERVVPIDKAEVDWSKTMAWSEGGYYARVFINVKDREPAGVVEKADYEKVRHELAEKICAIPDEKGNPIGTVAHKPEDLYREMKNIPPDLLIYFGNLAWRSLGTIGSGKIQSFDNDTGPDDANHAQYGIFILRDPQNLGKGQQLEGKKLYDIAPTVLRVLDVPIPQEMIGSPLLL